MRITEKIKSRKQGLSVFDKYKGELVYPMLNGRIKNRMIFKGQEVVVWSFNDYLGFISDERVIATESEIVQKYGACYPTGSRVLVGDTESHERLESELGELIGKDTMLYNLGYSGIVSTIQSLLDRNDVVIYDQEVHACLVDGVGLHIGNRKSFVHNNINHLEKQLKKTYENLNRQGAVLVVVDGVYSMRGDQANLDQIIELKKKYDFTLLVDDSHGFLVYGNHGSVGIDRINDVDIYISTFGKALSSLGGFVAANKDLIDHFKYNLRSQIFGRSLALVNVESVSFKLGLNQSEGDSRRKNLWKNTLALQNGLINSGLNIGNTTSPITPVYFDCSEEISAEVIHDLRYKYGIFCSCVTYPVIPKGRFILRLTATALHDLRDIHETIHAFEFVRERIAANTIHVRN